MLDQKERAAYIDSLVARAKDKTLDLTRERRRQMRLKATRLRRELSGKKPRKKVLHWSGTFEGVTYRIWDMLEGNYYRVTPKLPNADQQFITYDQALCFILKYLED